MKRTRFVPAIAGLVVSGLAFLIACGGGATNPVAATAPVQAGPPSITNIASIPAVVPYLGNTQVTVTASSTDGSALTYTYSSDHGSVRGNGSIVTYFAPAKGTSDTVHVTVTNDAGKTVSALGVGLDGNPPPCTNPYPKLCGRAADPPAPSPTPAPSNPKPSPTPSPTPQPHPTPTPNPPPAPPSVSVSGGGSCHPQSPSKPCSVSFTATASGGKAPLSYSWSGCTSGSGTSSTCAVNAIQSFGATVTVADALGRKATASGTATGTNTPPGPIQFTGTSPNPVVHGNSQFDVFYSVSDPDGDGLTCTFTGSAGDCSRTGGCGTTVYLNSGPTTGSCSLGIKVCDVWGACSTAKDTVAIQ